MIRTHGRVTTYINGKCRCMKCKVEWARYQRERARAIKAGTWVPIPRDIVARFGGIAVQLHGTGHRWNSEEGRAARAKRFEGGAK